MKLKLKKENLDLANSMIKKFEKEKEDLKKSLVGGSKAPELSEEIQAQIQQLLHENEELSKKLKEAEDKIHNYK